MAASYGYYGYTYTRSEAWDYVDAIEGKVADRTDASDGKLLAGSSKVSGVRGYSKDKKISLIGNVAEGAGKAEAKVTLNTSDTSIMSFGCNCFDFDGHHMCRHCVAVAYTWLANEYYYTFDYAIGYPSYIQWCASLPRSAGAFGAHPTDEQIDRMTEDDVPRSSWSVTDLINTYNKVALKESQDMLGASDAAATVPDKPAELTCNLRYITTRTLAAGTEDIWSLGFKIQIGRKGYVVKSLSKFVDAWETSKTLPYGSKFEFNHDPKNFSDHANDLIGFVSTIVETQEYVQRYQDSNTKRGYSYSSTQRVDDKTVPLSCSQLFDVLRREVGRTVRLEGGVSPAAKDLTPNSRTVTVEDENPIMRVDIARQDVFGFTLEVKPVRFSTIAGPDHLAVERDGTLYLTDADYARTLGRFFHTVSASSAKTNYISNADMGPFCKAMLPQLREFCDLRCPDDVDRYLPAPAEIVFRISGDKDLYFCRAQVTYGDQKIGLFDDVYEQGPTRDVAAETKAQALVRAYFPHNQPFTPDYLHPMAGPQHDLGYHVSMWGGRSPVPIPYFTEDDEDAYYDFFTSGLKELAQVGEVLLEEHLKNVTVRRTPKVNVRAEVEGRLLDLKVTSDEMEPAELMEYLSRWRKKERYVKLTSGDIIELDSSIASVANLADGLGLKDADIVGGIRLSSNRTLFVDAMLKRQEGVAFSRNAAFRRIVRDFETIADADFVVPETVCAEMRPYQTEGFRWLCTLGHVGFAGILADDMGLGKTLQAISYLAHAKEDMESDASDAKRLPSIVVCPASLVYNWESEIERFCPTMRAVPVVGSKKDREEIVAHAADYDVLVYSYDLMKRDVDALAEQSFHAAILDEAHYIKNANTLAAKAAKRLVAEVRFALTGTPIENRLVELWSIFDYLMPGVLGGKEQFTKRFVTPINQGSTEVTTSLARLVSPFILRRLKKDVLKDLPDKVENVVSSNLEGEQRKLYAAHAQRLRMTIEHQLPDEFQGMKLQILAELTKLRQLCCDPDLLFDDYKGPSAKLDTCLELVSQAIEGGHKILVFSQFTSMLAIISDRLKAAKIDHLTLTGSTSKEERRRLVDEFQAGAVPVFLISLKAGGVGLNLTAADIVIHYDPWWNVAAEDQATDRTHRIGQTAEVTVFKLIAKDTIEEKIVEMQRSKQALADAVIGGEGVSSGSITREDLLSLLEY